jgi:hypothetical protein
MDFVYVLVFGNDWEDITILLSEEDAINQSKKYPNNRVEIFSKNNKLEYKDINRNDNVGFTPTYNYYKNGLLVINT